MPYQLNYTIYFHHGYVPYFFVYKSARRGKMWYGYKPKTSLELLYGSIPFTCNIDSFPELCAVISGNKISF